MRGDILLLAFCIGNIAMLPFNQSGDSIALFLLFTITVLITITGLTGFRSNWKMRLYGTTLIIFFLLGLLNGTRTKCTSDYLSPNKMEPFNKMENATAENRVIERLRLRSRERFISRSEKIIGNKESLGVILAMTMGDKSHLDHPTLNAYRNSGAMHVLALSGLHVGIIYGMVTTLLLFMNFKYASRRLKPFVAICIIFVYAAWTGFGASVMRATIMITLYQIMRICHRQGRRWSTLIYSAAIMLLTWPESLRNVGFQLSYCAVAGIIFIYPELKQAVPFLKGFSKKIIAPIWKMISLSAACQIATLPLVWYYFNSAPHFFLIANLFAVPLTTLGIYTFITAYIIYDIPYIGEFAAVASEKTIMLLNALITMFE